MTSTDFEKSRFDMLLLLSEFSVAFDLGWTKKPYALTIPKNDKRIIGVGNNSLVFQLPENMVGKIFRYATSDVYEDVPDDVYHAVCKRSGTSIDPWGLERTLHWLHTMKLDVPIPEMKEYTFDHPQKKFYFTLTPNLTENKTYCVTEWDQNTPQNLKNYEDLKHQVDTTCQTISDKLDCLNLHLEPFGHGSEEDPMPALEHLFLVQKDDQGIGKLVIGDLNHLFIYHDDAQFGVRPEYISKE